jgi:hypothetical protein
MQPNTKKEKSQLAKKKSFIFLINSRVYQTNVAPKLLYISVKSIFLLFSGKKITRNDLSFIKCMSMYVSLYMIHKHQWEHQELYQI